MPPEWDLPLKVAALARPLNIKKIFSNSEEIYQHRKKSEKFDSTFILLFLYLTFFSERAKFMAEYILQRIDESL
jgi:hypothetical protein